MLDEWQEWAALGVAVVAVVGMILLYLHSGGKLKVKNAKGEINAGGAEEQEEPPECPTSIQIEHGNHFSRIDETLAKLAEVESQNAAMLRAFDRMQRAQNVGLVALLRKANGENINGDIKAAMDGLTREEGFKEAMMGGTA